MLVFFAVTILALSLIAMHIRVGVNFYLDLFENDGFVKIYIFGIRIFKAAIHFDHEAAGNNVVIKHGKKTAKVHLNTDASDKKSTAAMLKNPIIGNMLVEKVSAHFTVGKTNDSFFTVALTEVLRVLFYSLMSAVKCRYDVKITESFTPEYRRDVFQVDFIGIIAISIADIIVSIAASILGKPRKRSKQEVAKV